MAFSFIFTLLLVLPFPAQGVVTQSAVNPIRKVVTLLQNMQTKIAAEGKREAELFDKFMCYCKNNGGSLDQSISDGNSKISSLTASIKASSEKKTQTEQDLKAHQVSRDEANNAVAKANSLREKEAGAYAKESSDLTVNVGALTKAIAAIEKGVAGSFLQTQTAQTLRRFLMERADMADSSRQEVLSFLSGTQGEAYAPASGEIVGILKQLKDEMAGSLAEAVATEEAAIQSHKTLMTSKTKELTALTAQIEVELQRIGNLGVEIASMNNDLEDTQEAVAADGEFLGGLKAGCDKKKAEWEEIQKTRSAELLAIADTIKVLNDDDALDLFKKTLPTPSASFVQVELNAKTLRAQALSLIRGVKRAPLSVQPQLDFIELALSGKQMGFEKVTKMIDDMVANLKDEQRGDNNKQEYCNKEFDLADDKKKGLDNSISDSATAMEEMEGSIATLTEELAALEAGIKALDASVAEATAQRKNENADFKDLIASNTAAKELLLWAKNRLNKFYDAKLYKPAPKRELSEEERITLNMGGTLAPTSASGIADTGISVGLVQISTHVQGKVAPPPPPETFGAYSKKTDEGHGVTGMIDLLVKDLDQEMTEGETSEKDSQNDYERMMADAASKRASDSKSMTQKAASKANMEEELQSEKEAKTGSARELGATLKFIHELHAECDWLLKYFEVRKEARTGEIESLGRAKAVLSGASYSLL